MTWIAASDVLVIDIIVPVEGNHALGALMQQYNMQPGGKIAIDKAGYDTFAHAVQAHPLTVLPGGSSANFLTTLAKLLGADVNIDFIGIAGCNADGASIRQSLEEARIRLLPVQLPPGAVPQHAVSFVALLPDGQRSIATYPGNARDLLTPEMVDERIVATSDAVLLQSSLWEKFHWPYANRWLELCRSYKKSLWLALPTHARATSQFSALFNELLTASHVLFGNEEELARLYDDRPANAIGRLQETYRTHLKEMSPVAFITQGERGALVIDAHEVIAVAAAPSERVVNTLGAGDTAFAAFAAGLLRGLPHCRAAEIAMQLAAAKLQVNGPRLDDPLHALGMDAFPNT